jgi:hypothetical protein
MPRQCPHSGFLQKVHNKTIPVQDRDPLLVREWRTQTGKAKNLSSPTSVTPPPRVSIGSLIPYRPVSQHSAYCYTYGIRGPHCIRGCITS